MISSVPGKCASSERRLEQSPPCHNFVIWTRRAGDAMDLSGEFRFSAGGDLAPHNVAALVSIAIHAGEALRIGSEEKAQPQRPH